ncbi:acyl-CoA dehydrogenase family protein [Mycobacterium sp. CVI_P3]|uniref:Acyl-CoA dehydrogenase family protein n=1 Tax=Mycobacterium pinniadriaticum TaxID=2994102 RepID=A0ABT3SF70_9MYCO|nr:acyl-CoA dehydrogenase family protein [Mycobacterium pinniadriaticum]MCX2931764.1 acyl-CoA dehydrogenase family protein [Mycobacterium pinniadriaticum]MCX2938161.1 acyl-CoA dehydrogenase family protein [Mycobacterium pinniadriaticum]
MNFGVIEVGPEVQAFRGEVQQFLDEHLTPEVIAEDRLTGNGHSQAFHEALGARGWIMPMWPVEEGGAGLDPLRARILALELAWRQSMWVSISRLITTTIALGVRAWASDTLREEILPGVARGTVLMCLGYTEPDSGSDMAAAKTRATHDGDDWVIQGQKMFTTGAQNSHYVWLLARTDPDAPKTQGLTMFLVPLDRPGIEITPIHTLGGERTNTVYLDSVRVSDHYRVGPVGQGWRVVAGALDAEHRMGRIEDRGIGDDANMGTWQGLIHRLTDVAVRWAASGQHPDGSPVADDPLACERVAQVALDAEVAAILEGPMSKVATATSLIRGSADLIDLFGPAGTLLAGEDGAVCDGDVEFLHRFAQGTAIYGGSVEIFHNMLAERVLGLPRARMLPPRERT